MIHAHKCWMGTHSRLTLLGYWDVAGMSPAPLYPNSRGGQAQEDVSHPWCEHHLHPQHHPGRALGEAVRRIRPGGHNNGRASLFLI